MVKERAEEAEEAEELISWCFEPRQPQRITSFLKKKNNNNNNNNKAAAQWLARCAYGPVKAATMGSTPGRDRVCQFFRVNTCADYSLPVSPPCAQHAPRSLRTLKIPCPPILIAE